MATVQLADVYVPLTFNRRMQEAQIEQNAFLASGIAAADPVLAQQFANGGTTAELPQYNGISITEPNIGTDNPATLATPGNISSKKQIARSASRNYHWSTMDLARELAIEDPMGAITSRVGAFWATDDEKRIINSSVGILADNIANDSSDMLEDIYSDVVVGSLTDANRISADAILNALQTLGDKKSLITVIAMHSVLHTKLQKLQLLVDNVNPTTGELVSQTYLGKRVVVDDSLPVTAGTNSPKYTVALYGAGLFSFAPAPVLTPSELDRNPLAGNGSGETILSTRTNTVFHPNGFQCIGSGWAKSAAGTYAELAAAATWDRVVERKNVPLAFITCNG